MWECPLLSLSEARSSHRLLSLCLLKVRTESGDLPVRDKDVYAETLTLALFKIMRNWK